MLRSLFLLACVAAVVLGEAKFEEEDDVIIGTAENFDELIKDFNPTLVEFYAPWCGHCKSLAPEYAKAAAELKGDGIRIIKVDATVHSELGGRYQVQGYPTLKWFKHGKASEYSGGRTAADIVSWIKKKSGPAAVPVDTAEKAKALAEANDVVVLGFFESEDSDEAKAFVATADATETVFGLATDKAVADEYSVTAPAIVLLKKFDEGRSNYDGEFTSEAISAFVSANSLPLVMEFSDESAPKIFGGDVKSHFLLFVKKSAEDFETLKSALADTAPDHKGKLLFVYIDADVENNMRVLEFFGLAGTDLPALRIINLESEMAKFKPEAAEINADTIKAFASDYVEGKLKKFLMAEDVPEDWDAKPVKVLTGKNFAEVALDDTKNVFVEFYAPWCGHCKQLAPVWDTLGERFEGKDVVIAKIDSTGNELEDLDIQGFPTLKFFPAGKEGAVVDYDGARTLAGFVKFIKEQTGIEVELTEEDKAAEAGEAGEDDYGDGEDYAEEEEQAAPTAPEGAAHEEL